MRRLTKRRCCQHTYMDRVPSWPTLGPVNKPSPAPFPTEAVGNTELSAPNALPPVILVFWKSCRLRAYDNMNWPTSSRVEMRASLAQQRVHVFEERARTRSTLGEHLAVVDERTRRHIRRSVESQHQHSSIETTLCASPACRKRTR